uniref:Uncharacterized protein n=1 Tax=Ralstonia solanacearum TaxID=305 RepID=A0A809DUF5_RALSL
MKNRSPRQCHLKHVTHTVIAALLIGIAGTGLAVEPDEICRHFSDEIRRLEHLHPHQDPSETGAPELCFKNQRECGKDDVPAEQFWQAAKSPDAAKSIQKALEGGSDSIGRVSHIRMRGLAAPIVRIGRRVGRWNCIRDTYLVRDEHGYAILDNPSLQNFSQETGYCRRDYVIYHQWRGDTYAIASENSERGRQLEVFRMNAALALDKVCKTHAKP